LLALSAEACCTGLIIRLQLELNLTRQVHSLTGAQTLSARHSTRHGVRPVLDPKLRDVVPEFDGRAVEFTKFDFSIGQPETLTTKAEALGVKSVYLQNKGATGFMALIDRRDQSVIAIISMRDSKDDIRTKIEAGIKTASKPLERMTL
jgi:hypothetical protein